MKNIKTQILLPILACSLWASTFANSKVALTFMSPYWMAATRFFTSGVVVFFISVLGSFFIKKRNGFKFFFGELKKGWKFVVLVGFLQIGINYTLFYAGIDRVPGSAAAVINGSSPFVVAIVTHIFLVDDKMSFKKVFSIIVGILGILFLNFGKGFSGSFSSSEFLGMFLLFLSTVVSAFSGIVVKKSSKNIDPIVLNSSQLIFGSLWLFLLAYIFQGKITIPVAPKFYISWVSLVFVSAFAFSIWYYIIQRPEVKLSDINLFKFLIPVLGSILSWILVKDDNPDIWTILGIVLVSSGIIFYFFNPKHFKTKKTNILKEENKG